MSVTGADGVNWISVHVEQLSHSTQVPAFTLPAGYRHFDVLYVLCMGPPK